MAGYIRLFGVSIGIHAWMRMGRQSLLQAVDESRARLKQQLLVKDPIRCSADSFPRTEYRQRVLALSVLANGIHTHIWLFLFQWAHLPYQKCYTLHHILNTHPTGYIGEFEIIDDHRANKIVIELTGRLNKCGVISPRFDVAFDEIEKWIVNLLPSRQFGHLLLSTTYGIMTHEEARRKKTGGKILGFFY